MLKLADIWVSDAFVYPDLGHELLFRSCFNERCFLNKFARKYVLCFITDKFVALGEASLAEKLALVVKPSSITTVLLLKLFLDN